MSAAQMLYEACKRLLDWTGTVEGFEVLADDVLPLAENAVAAYEAEQSLPWPKGAAEAELFERLAEMGEAGE